MKSQKTRRRAPGQIQSMNEVRRDVAANNAERAWKLRAEGKSVVEIATVVGVSEVSIRKYLRAGLVRARETAGVSACEHLLLSLARLDQLISSWSDLAHSPGAEGAEGAALIMLRSMDSEARLLGLYGLPLQADSPREIDVSEALKSKAARDALRRMLDAADSRG
jgi:hypothetical protein